MSNESNKEKSGFTKIFVKGAAWVVLVRALAVLTNLGLNMLIARLLAPEQVGEYFLLLSVASVVTAFSLFGLNISIVRIVARAMAAENYGETRSAVVKSHFMGAISSMAMAALLYFIGVDLLATYIFKTNVLHDYRLLLAIWIVLWSMVNLNVDIFRGFKQFHLATMFRRFLPNLVMLMIALYLFVSGFNLELVDYLNIILFAWFICLVMSSLIMSRYFLRDKRMCEGDISVRELASSASPLWVTGGVSFSIKQMDLWVLAMVEPPERLALYGVATRLIQIVEAPLMVVQSVVGPLIAETYGVNDRELSRGLQTTSAVAFIPGVFLCLIYLVAGGYILGFIYGEYYAAALPVLQIMAVGFIVRLMSGNSQTLLTMSGNGRAAMTISIVSGLFMILGCLLVVEKYGMNGVALISSVTVGVHFIVCMIMARKLTGIWSFPMLRVTQIKHICGLRK